MRKHSTSHADVATVLLIEIVAAGSARAVPMDEAAHLPDCARGTQHDVESGCGATMKRSVPTNRRAAVRESLPPVSGHGRRQRFAIDATTRVASPLHRHTAAG